MAHKFSWHESSNQCCGVTELGGFSQHARPFYGVHVSTDTEEELWPKVFEKMIAPSRQRVAWGGRKGGFVHIWFKKPMGRPTYEFPKLMEMFKNHPKVLDLGNHTNPRTRNRIQGFGLKVYGR